MAGPQPEGAPRRRGRLSRSADFERAYRHGRSRANRYAVLYSFPRSDEQGSGPRLGVSVGRRVGNAVRRNAVKRALREAFWRLGPELSSDRDYVVVARRDLDELVADRGTDGARAALAELVAAGEERFT